MAVVGKDVDIVSFVVTVKKVVEFVTFVDICIVVIGNVMSLVGPGKSVVDEDVDFDFSVKRVIGTSVSLKVVLGSTVGVGEDIEIDS